MKKNTAPKNGALLIHKEAGMTSFDVIRALRVRFPGQKWGHSGTLDPFATGVLLLLLGYATRLQNELHLLPKTYRAEITLGATSTTDDSTGDILHSKQSPDEATQPLKAHVLNALKDIKKQTTQIPPQYAAIKVKGKKLYEYAREGKSVERNARPITIHEITLEEYTYPTLRISVTCSTGTYIRSIARDIGEILGTGAYCSSLARTAIGPFISEKASFLHDLPNDLETALIPPEQLVSHIPSIQYSEDNVAKLIQGREVACEAHTPIDTPVALLNADAKLFGIGIRKTSAPAIQPNKIFVIPH